jgi:hypothetical protein
MKRLFPLLVLLVLLVPEAAATTVRSFSLPQLFREADHVVVGKVVGQRSFWNEAHDTIYTDFTVAVEATEKGAQVENVTVRLMGGTVGATRLSISGNASLKEGERVLLVLRDQGDFHTLVGMSQGKWNVRRVEGIDVVQRGPAPAGTDLFSTRQPKPLSELLKQLRAAPIPSQQPEVTP